MPRALIGMPTQRPNRVCAIFTGNEFGRRHGASLHIFACRPLVWSADYLDAMLRLSPRGEIAPPWSDINERTPLAVKGQCTRCGAQTDALRADFDRFESHTGVVAGLSRHRKPVGGGARCANRATTRVAPTTLPAVGATLVVAQPLPTLRETQQSAPQFFSSSSRVGHSRIS